MFYYFLFDEFPVKQKTEELGRQVWQKTCGNFFFFNLSIFPGEYLENFNIYKGS